MNRLKDKKYYRRKRGTFHDETVNFPGNIRVLNLYELKERYLKYIKQILIALKKEWSKSSSWGEILIHSSSK